jgi:uncharacterized protein
MLWNERKMLNLKPLVHRILEDYTLPWHGIHGVGHWARVLENGLRLARETNANIEVVQLFAIFHDAGRGDEGYDLGHGRRGAELARLFRTEWLVLADEKFDLLYEACAGHADGDTEADITIQTCWDADRLDLGRVAICPEPTMLCTEAAKRPEILKWADGRACFEVIPDFVLDDWGIDLEGSDKENQPD